MSYTPRYTRRNYVNNQAPSINAENLNAIENAIVGLEQNAQSYSNKVDTLQTQSATKTELNTAKRELSEDIAFANQAIADEIEAREASEAEMRNEIAKVANSNIQTSSDVLDFAMDGNIINARFEGYARKSKNLLNSTLQTTTQNGITCTRNNTDGTYTLNGTATDKTIFNINFSMKNIPSEYKLIGVPKGGTSTTYYATYSYNRTWLNAWDYGNGNIVNFENINTYCIVIESGYICNNLVFKPMLTTDTSATYDDYEPYGIIKPSGVVKSQGKNLLDKKTDAIGYIETSSMKIVATSTNRYAYAKIKPNTTYTISKKVGKAFRVGTSADVPNDGVSVISTVANHTGSKITVTSESNANYLIVMYWGNGTEGTFEDMLDSIQIEEGTEATTYKPYEKSETTLPYIPLGVGDIHDELIVNADGSGKYIKRVYQKIFDGTETITLASNGVYYYSLNPNYAVSSFYGTDIGITDKFKSTSHANIGAGEYVFAVNDNNAYFKMTSATTLQEMKDYLKNSMMVYALATEQIINLTASQVEQILALKTFADTTYIDADGMHYDIGYAQNSAKAIKELQNIIKNLLNPQTEAVEEQISAMSDDEEGEEANV